MNTRRPAFPARLEGADAPKKDDPIRPQASRPGPSATRSTLSAAWAPNRANPRPGVVQGLDPRQKVQARAPAPSGLGLDSHAVRERMVQKLAAQGVSDPLVLQAMGQVERHRFVEPALVGQAYEDTSLPIGLGQTISKPNVVARMIELLHVGQSGRLGRVLEIGTGCGYQAAVLSHVATEVYSIERLRGLHDKSRENLRPLRLHNVHLLFGDGMLGYPKGAPYAGIISAAGGEHVPEAWLEQLAVGGRLVAPTVTPSGHQALVVIHKTEQGHTRQVLEAVHFVPLKSGTQ